MRRGLYFIVLFVLFLMLSAAFRPAAGPTWEEDEILIKFKPAVTTSSVSSLLAALNARVLDYTPELGLRHIRLPQKMAVADAITQMLASDLVDYAEPNYRCHAFVKPNDPLYSRLWGLENTGQDDGSSGADITAASAWNIATGSQNVVIGIIDSGIDYKHEDLRHALYTNPGEDPWSDSDDPTTGNKVDDDANGYVDDWKGWNFVSASNDPYDDNSHGSHCAGTIGAVGNNNTGITGVCWNVRIISLKFLDENGDGNVANAAKAIVYAANLGIRILNNSWGGNEYSRALYDAIQYANSKGVLFVAAAGNDGVNTDQYPNYPSCYDLENIISVAASDNKDQLAVWGSEETPSDDCGFICNSVMAATPGSNFGPISVDLAAPGKGIWSTVPGGYARFDGTSMAAPHVSGVAGLILAKYPALSHLQIRARIMANVDQRESFSAVVASGGRLNAFKALQ
jgi:subtilisin family serine protease